MQEKDRTADPMDSIKKKIYEKQIDRRELARRMGISPAYLNNILNGWSPIKADQEKTIREVLELR